MSSPRIKKYSTQQKATPSDTQATHGLCGTSMTTVATSILAGAHTYALFHFFVLIFSAQAGNKKDKKSSSNVGNQVRFQATRLAFKLLPTSLLPASLLVKPSKLWLLVFLSHSHTMLTLLVSLNSLFCGTLSPNSFECWIH